MVSPGHSAHQAPHVAAPPRPRPLAFGRRLAFAGEVVAKGC